MVFNEHWQLKCLTMSRKFTFTPSNLFITLQTHGQRFFSHTYIRNRRTSIVFLSVICNRNSGRNNNCSHSVSWFCYRNHRDDAPFSPCANHRLPQSVLWVRVNDCIRSSNAGLLFIRLALSHYRKRNHSTNRVGHFG